MPWGRFPDPQPASEQTTHPNERGRVTSEVAIIKFPPGIVRNGMFPCRRRTNITPPFCRGIFWPHFSLAVAAASQLFSSAANRIKPSTHQEKAVFISLPEDNLLAMCPLELALLFWQTGRRLWSFPSPTLASSSFWIPTPKNFCRAELSSEMSVGVAFPWRFVKPICL